MSSIRLFVWLFNDKPTVLTLTLSSLDGRVVFKGLVLNLHSLQCRRYFEMDDSIKQVFDAAILDCI